MLRIRLNFLEKGDFETQKLRKPCSFNSKSFIFQNKVVSKTYLEIMNNAMSCRNSNGISELTTIQLADLLKKRIIRGSSEIPLPSLMSKNNVIIVVSRGASLRRPDTVQTPG